MTEVTGVRTEVVGIPAMSWGPPSGSVLLAVHGAFGDKQDATIRRVVGVAVPLGFHVVSIDLPGHGERTDPDRLVPWSCAPEIVAVHEVLLGTGRSVDLFACSLGAYFSLVALAGHRVGRALLLAPLVDMGAHIERLMRAHAVSDDRLRREMTIDLPGGQFLDWRYLTYARDHPVRWPHSCDVLWGERDEMVPEVDIVRFVAASGARVERIDAGHAFTAAHDPMVDAWLFASLTRARRAPARL